MRSLALVTSLVVFLVVACATTSGDSENAMRPNSAGKLGPGSSSSSSTSTLMKPAPAAPEIEETDVDAIPWETGGDVGFGIARKDTQNPRGNSVLVAYAGYRLDLGAAKAWSTALYRATLRDRGVRFVWAVQGPAQENYAAREIGNSKLIASVLAHVGDGTRFIAVIAHSSGCFVAHEMFAQLGLGDADGSIRKRIVYFDLDGSADGLWPSTVDHLRRAYFVGAFDSSTQTYSPNAIDMKNAGAKYAIAGGYIENDAREAGCPKGRVWCLHATMITTRPHPDVADPRIDYSDFDGRAVTHGYLDEKADEAELSP